MNRYILIVTDEFIHYERGAYCLFPRGSAIQLYHVLRFAMNNSNLRFTVVQMRGPKAHVRFHGIDVYCADQSDINAYIENIQCMNVPYELLHFNNIDLFFHAGHKQPMTATIHTNVFIEKPDAKRWLEGILPFLTKVITVNAAYSQALKDARITLIRNGIDSACFPFMEKKTLVSEDGTIPLFFPNVIEPKKNFRFAYNLLSELNTHPPRRYSLRRFRLFVAGDDKLDLQCPDITYLGRLDHEDMHRHYQAAAFTLIPSFTESCSLCMLESMSCGTLVLANDTEGLNEYIENGVTGHLVSIDQKTSLQEWATIVYDFLCDLGQYNTIARTASQYTQHYFTTDEMSCSYMRAWLECLKKL